MKRIAEQHGMLRTVPQDSGVPYVLAVLCVPGGEAGLSDVPSVFAEALEQLLAQAPAGRAVGPAAVEAPPDGECPRRDLAEVREWMIENL